MEDISMTFWMTFQIIFWITKWLFKWFFKLTNDFSKWLFQMTWNQHPIGYQNWAPNLEPKFSTKLGTKNKHQIWYQNQLPHHFWNDFSDEFSNDFLPDFLKFFMNDLQNGFPIDYSEDFLDDQLSLFYFSSLLFILNSWFLILKHSIPLKTLSAQAWLWSSSISYEDLFLPYN